MRAATSGPCRWPRITLFLLVFALVAVAVPMATWAQAVNTGNIAGQVTDPQGAVVPGVKITMTDSATNTTYTATTNNEGRYFLANVAPATYNMTAAKSGFATAKIAAQTVTVGGTSTVDIKMTVGEVSTTVEVQAAGNTELQTMNATIGNTIPTAALSNLPAIGLDVSTFAVLQPGVAPDGSTAGTVGDQSTFMLDGGNNTSDMDGSMQTYTGGFGADPSGGTAMQGVFNENTLPSGVVPTPADSVEEIKTNTTNQTADFNSSSGMQVQVVTKRGTNRWHGTAYEYYLDNNFSANSWQNNCSTACGNVSSTKQADWHRSWFGVAGGGPIISKNILGGKTYFFGNYQGSRFPFSETYERNVPGPGMLQGLLEFDGTVYNLNPGPVTYTGPTITGKCSNCALVNGKVYPSSGLDPRGLGLNPVVSSIWNKYVPKLLTMPGYDFSGGTADGNIFGYKGTVALPQTSNFGVARIDHDFGANWHFFGSYRYFRFLSASDNQVDIGGFLPGSVVGVPSSHSGNPQLPWYYVAGLTTNISPTTTNDFHWSFTRNWWKWDRAGDVPQVAGLNGSLGAALEPGGESTTGSLIPYAVNTQNTRTRFWDGLDDMFRDDITSLKGNHLLQFGGTYQRNRDKHQRTDNGGGINYQTVYLLGSGSGSANNSAVLPATLAAGRDNNYINEYDEILGMVTTSQIAYTRSGPNLTLNPPLTPASDNSLIPFYNVYFSDSWHIKPSLTLTYGLGWALEMPPVETQGRQINLVDASGQQLDVNAYLGARERAALQGQSYTPPIGYALVGNTGSGQKYPYKPFYGSFSPRFAAAWNPDFGDGFLGRHLFGGKSTVIRGGYGRIYGRLNGVDLVLVPLLGTGLIQPVQCIDPIMGTTQGCAGTGGGDPASTFRIGTDGNTAPLAAVSPTLPQPDFPGISICGAPNPTSKCPSAAPGSVFDPNFRPNSVDSITVSVQRQLGQRNTIEIGYIGRWIRNEFIPININNVPYMFTMGGQQFQTAYANIETAMGCATSVVACYNASPTMSSLANIAPQPFFESALGGATSAYCKAFANCTQAVIAKQFGNLQSQNVWSLWSALDNPNASCSGTPCHPFVFAPTLYNRTGQLANDFAIQSSDGYGNYNGGFLSWRMNNWHGLTSQSNFTWAKALGTATVVQATSGYTADDAYNMRTGYGPQQFDHKFVFNSFLVYDLPFFRDQTGIIGRLLGGWNVGPLFSAASGRANSCNGGIGDTAAQAFGAASGSGTSDVEQCVFTAPYTAGTSLHSGIVAQTDAAGNTVGDSTNPGASAQLNQFANPLAVWNTVRPAILGIDNGHNGGTGVIRGFPSWNMDLSIKKNMKFTERFSGTFQAVFTNVLNHFQPTDPFLDVGTPSCWGVISSGCSGGPQQNAPRQVELSLRINF